MVHALNLKKVIQVVLRCVGTEKIALIGYTDHHGKARSVFNEDSIPVSSIREANILVIAKDDCEKAALNDQIEQQCKLIMPVTCCTLTVHEFIRMGQEGCVFINTILSSGCIIYEESMNPVNIPVVAVSAAFIEKNNKEITSWYKYAVVFREMACSQLQLGDNRMAVFCLHQATEQFLIMLIQSVTGYRLGTHNIVKLIRFLRFHNKDAAEVFTCSTASKLQSLHILRESYITSRYKIDLTISDENVHYLMGEVYRLQGIAERVLLQRVIGAGVPV